MVKDLKNVGKRGEIVNVSDGYGANYVIPQGYGRLLDNAAIADYNAEQKKAAEDDAKAREDAKALAVRLNSMEIVFTAKAGKSGSMIGTISPKAIEEKMKETYGIEIDKRKFIDHFSVNAFGVTKLRIELYKDVVGTITIRVNEEKQ